MYNNSIYFAYISLGDSIKTNIDGIDISYEVIGSGYPMVLLHGWGANKTTFAKLSKNLSSRFKVYRMDLPGFGESNIGLPLNLNEVTDLVYHFVQKLEIKKPILLGHSYGGRIAIIYASKYPVEKLILVSAAGIKQDLSLKKRVSIKVYKILKKCKIKVKMGSKDYLDSDNVKRKMLVQAVNQDLSKEMKEIQGVETLLIYGEKDTTTPISMAKKIEKNIKNSALVTIEDSGHFPYLEQPTIFQLILDSFLAGNCE